MQMLETPAVAVAIDVELVDRATFIFEGEVVAEGRGSLPILAGRPRLAVVRFGRGFRVNPVLGQLKGRPITVGLQGQGELKEGERVLVLANSWVHGREIAVVALAVFPFGERVVSELDAALAALPELYRARRVATAQLIVQGQVESVKPIEVRQPLSEHMARWSQAEISVSQVLKDGQNGHDARRGVRALFPRNTDSFWSPWPKLKEGQRRVFLLHPATRRPLPEGTLTLPDPSDVQPAASVKAIRAMLGQNGGNR
jgi:hypothetical protein